MYKLIEVTDETPDLIARFRPSMTGDVKGGFCVNLTDADLETAKNALVNVADDCKKAADDERLPSALRAAMRESREKYLRTYDRLEGNAPGEAMA